MAKLECVYSEAELHSAATFRDRLTTANILALAEVSFFLLSGLVLSAITKDPTGLQAGGIASAVGVIGSYGANLPEILEYFIPRTYKRIRYGSRTVKKVA